MKKPRDTVTDCSGGKPMVYYSVLESVSQALKQGHVHAAQHMIGEVREECCPSPLIPLTIVEQERT